MAPSVSDTLIIIFLVVLSLLSGAFTIVVLTSSYFEYKAGAIKNRTSFIITSLQYLSIAVASGVFSYFSMDAAYDILSFYLT